MPHATLPRPLAPAPGAGLGGGPAATADRLADAVAEFDAALAAGRPMFVLVRLDQEVAAADRRHRAALAATRTV